MRYYKIKRATKAWKTETNIMCTERKGPVGSVGTGVGYKVGKGEMCVFSKQQQVFLCTERDRIIWGFLGRYICYSGSQEAMGISDQLSITYLDRCPGTVGWWLYGPHEGDQEMQQTSISQPATRMMARGRKEGCEGCRAGLCSPFVRMTEVTDISPVCRHQSVYVHAVIPA